MLKLPKKEKSLWREYSPGLIFPELTEDIQVDSVIIGGGIAGLSSAYFLKKTGQRVVVLEKETIGAGTTGRTTGKVTSQHNLFYAEQIKRHGRDKMKLYADINQRAVEQVARIIKDEKIDCDWARDDHWVYTAKKEEVAKFRSEAKAAADLGLPATFEKTSSLPFKITAAVRFAGQGKFNSQKYLLGLANCVNGQGSYVFENSQAVVIRGGRNPVVRTKHASVYARSIIVATHVPTFPMAARLNYGALEYPTESFLVATEVPKKLSGMYISPDDDHYSILPIKMDGKNYLLIGGEGGNIPGLRLSKNKRYQKLGDYAGDNFRANAVTHKWSDMDYRGYDNLPLIGKLYPWSRNIYVATGFLKWGLSNGTAAGMLLSDLITGQPNPAAKVFDPGRSSTIKNIPRAALKQILGKN